MGNGIYTQWTNHPFDETISDNTKIYLKFIDDNEAWFYCISNTDKSILEYLVTTSAQFTLRKIKDDYRDAFEALKSVDKSILYASKSKIRDQLLNVLIDDRESLGVKLKTAEDNDNVEEVARLLDAGAPVDVDAYIDRKTNKNIYKQYLDLGYIKANHIFDLIDKSTDCALELIEACDRENIDIRGSGTPIEKAVRQSNLEVVKVLMDANVNVNVMEIAIKNIIDEKEDAASVYEFLIKKFTKKQLRENKTDLLFLTISNNLTAPALLMIDKIGIEKIGKELSSYTITNSDMILFDKLYKQFLEPQDSIDLCIEKRRKGMFIKLVDYYAKTDNDYVRILYNNPPLDFIYLTLRLWDPIDFDGFEASRIAAYGVTKKSLIWYYFENNMIPSDKNYFNKSIRKLANETVARCAKDNDDFLQQFSNVKTLYEDSPLRFQLKF
tara:strand:- start:1291 stop:2607 length:1317 start_codon:yes stop_codon:yes gene_type:complete